MRIFLLPISTRRSLIYAQRLEDKVPSKKSLVERITARANKQWVSWEAVESGWQKKVTDWGNAAFARIPYQEWGLKSLPPLSSQRQAEKTQVKVDVVYPKGVIREGQVEEALRQLATQRKGLHRRWMWWSLVGMPLTAPFALIPIIPNLPFFYLVFRAWSHWRAHSGAQHIEFLLDNRLLRPLASRPLQTTYEVRTIAPEQMEQLKAINADEQMQDETRITQALKIIDRPSKRQPVKEVSETSEEELLLEKRSGKLVARVLKLPGLDVEIERAVDQISRLMAKEAQEKNAQAKSAEGMSLKDHEKEQ